MLNLILNENMKIYRRPRTWLMVGFVLAVLMIHAFSTWYYVADQPVDPNWKQELVERNQELQEVLDERAADLTESDKRSLNSRIMINEYYIEHDMAPEGVNVWSQLDDSLEMIMLVVIVTVVVAGDIVSSEFSGGTIKMLLIRPVNRTKVLLSKYVAVLMYAAFMMTILYVTVYLLGGILFGFDGADRPYIYISPDDNTIQEMTMIKHILLNICLDIVPLILTVTMAFMISAALRSTALAIMVSMMGLFVGMNIVEFFSNYSWVKYILFTNLSLGQYFEGPIRIEGMTLSFSLTVLAVYFVVFHLFAWLLFTKRDVAA